MLIVLKMCSLFCWKWNIYLLFVYRLSGNICYFVNFVKNLTKPWLSEDILLCGQIPYVNCFQRVLMIYKYRCDFAEIHNFIWFLCGTPTPCTCVFHVSVKFTPKPHKKSPKSGCPFDWFTILQGNHCAFLARGHMKDTEKHLFANL